jgi:hypothetical protein
MTVWQVTKRGTTQLTASHLRQQSTREESDSCQSKDPIAQPPNSLAYLKEKYTLKGAYNKDLS